MKKLISAVLLLTVAACFLLAGCDGMDNDYENKIKDDVYATYESLKADLSGADSNDEIMDYLNSWADKNSIFSEKLTDCGIVMSKDSDKKNSKSSSVTYQCRIDHSSKTDTFTSAAIAMTVLNDTENHGKITVLFTDGTKGAQNLPDKYIKTDHFISLTERSTPRLFTGSAATAEYDISKKTSTKATEGTKAYKISISGCRGGDSAVRDTRHANPVVAIGNLLNECRNSGIILEIKSFNGGDQAWNYPKSATAVVVVASSEEDKFVSKAENERDSYKDKHLKNESDMDYTVSKVPLPSTVLSDADTSSILSLFYTMEDGVYATSEPDDKGDLVALANIGSVSTSGGSINIGVFARSTDTSVFKEMKKTYSDTADLSDASLKVVTSIPVWPQKENDPLAESVIVAGSQADLKLSADYTFMRNDAAIFYSMDNDLDIVSMGVDIQDAFEITKTLVTFNETLVEE